jgi:hypothetical protein
MEITLSLKNIESVLFRNEKLAQQFPEFKHYFDQWKLSKQYSFLKNVGVQAIIDLMNNLTETHLEKIEDFYKVKFKALKIKNKLIYNYEFDVDSIVDNLDELPLVTNLCICRNKEKIFVTSWD